MRMPRKVVVVDADGGRERDEALVQIQGLLDHELVAGRKRNDCVRPWDDRRLHGLVGARVGMGGVDRPLHKPGRLVRHVAEVDRIPSRVREELLAKPREVSVDERQRVSLAVPQHEFPSKKRALDPSVLLRPDEQVVAALQEPPFLLDLSYPLVVRVLNVHCRRDEVRRPPHLEKHAPVWRQDGGLEPTTGPQQLAPDHRTHATVLLGQQRDDLPVLVSHGVVLRLLESQQDLTPLDITGDHEGAARHGGDELIGGLPRWGGRGRGRRLQGST